MTPLQIGFWAFAIIVVGVFAAAGLAKVAVVVMRWRRRRARP